MKVYKVKVNGKVYEVELESVKESDAKITAPTPAAAPVAAAPAQSGAGKDLVAPMAGTILDVKVNVGTEEEPKYEVYVLDDSVLNVNE